MQDETDPRQFTAPDNRPALGETPLGLFVDAVLAVDEYDAEDAFYTYDERELGIAPAAFATDADQQQNYWR